MQYRVVIEPAGENYSAYVPDLPGCIATGATPEAVARAVYEAIDFHVAALLADGEQVPPPKEENLNCDGPFAMFAEWAHEIDTADYANL